MNTRTKIVCTIGPACDSVETITQMVAAGMSIARLNFSHGSYESHAELIEHIREVEKQTGQPITILQDLQGPKIRIGTLPEEGVVLVQGSQVVFDTGIKEYTEQRIPLDYEALHTFLHPQERVLISDGKIETVVLSVEGTQITTEVRVGGTIFSHKGINVPDSTLSIRALTDKDKEDAKFGVLHGVDFMALSFVTSPEDILDLKFALKEYEKEANIDPEQPIHIIAKIERREAVDRIDAILDVVDGIMIARGDLGIEIPAAEVPIVQKQLIDRALAHAKPVIVATQMLDSMQEIPRPTRAEVSDVAHAVMDHTDAVMLSNETATGKYPVITVQTMHDIIVEAEASVYDNMPSPVYTEKESPIDTTLSAMSRVLAEETHATLILAASISGTTGRMISRYRPELPIAVATHSERARHQLQLSWGVLPFVLPACRTIEELVERSLVYLKKQALIAPGNRIIVVAGEPVGQAGHVNLLEVRDVT